MSWEHEGVDCRITYRWEFSPQPGRTIQWSAGVVEDILDSKIKWRAKFARITDADVALFIACEQRWSCRIAISFEGEKEPMPYQHMKVVINTFRRKLGKALRDFCDASSVVKIIGVEWGTACENLVGMPISD